MKYREYYFLLSIMLAHSCRSTGNLHSIEEVMFFLDQQKRAKISIEELTSHLTFQRINAFSHGDQIVSYNIFFSDVIINAKDTCWLTIDYNTEAHRIVDYCKSCP